MVYKQEEIKPYDSGGSKSQQVEKMFDNIAHSYDKLNHRLSWNIDKIWRRAAINHLRSLNPQTIVDVATGTGDFAILAAKKIRPSKIIGIDISESMMEIGRIKTKRQNLEDIISFKKEDCLNMSFADNSFDAIMSAFGIRNFENLDQGLREMYRVIKPGGELCVIELTTPVRFPFKQLFKFYSHTFLPFYGKLISKDNSAYSYLTTTIEAFPQGEQMVGILLKAGFKDARFKRLSFGICTMYFASK